MTEKSEIKTYFGRCRCCLTSGYLKNMWTKHKFKDQTEVYGEMLIQCFALTWTEFEDSAVLDQICAQCINRLRNANDFKKMVLDSQEVLTQEMVEEYQTANETEIKVEVDTIEDAETSNQYLEYKPPESDGDPADSTHADEASGDAVYADAVDEDTEYSADTCNSIKEEVEYEELEKEAEYEELEKEAEYEVVEKEAEYEDVEKEAEYEEVEYLEDEGDLKEDATSSHVNEKRPKSAPKRRKPAEENDNEDTPKRKWPKKLPKAERHKTYKQYTEEQLRQCVEAVTNGEMNPHEAALLYNIPKKTICAKIKEGPRDVPTDNTTNTVNSTEDETLKVNINLDDVPVESGTAKIPNEQIDNDISRDNELKQNKEVDKVLILNQSGDDDKKVSENDDEVGKQNDTEKTLSKEINLNDEIDQNKPTDVFKIPNEFKEETKLRNDNDVIPDDDVSSDDDTESRLIIDDLCENNADSDKPQVNESVTTDAAINNVMRTTEKVLNDETSPINGIDKPDDSKNLIAYVDKDVIVSESKKPDNIKVESEKNPKSVDEALVMIAIEPEPKKENDIDKIDDTLQLNANADNFLVGTHTDINNSDINELDVKINKVDGNVLNVNKDKALVTVDTEISSNNEVDPKLDNNEIGISIDVKIDDNKIDLKIHNNDVTLGLDDDNLKYLDVRENAVLVMSDSENNSNASIDFESEDNDDDDDYEIPSENETDTETEEETETNAEEPNNDSLTQQNENMDVVLEFSDSENGSDRETDVKSNEKDLNVLEKLKINIITILDYTNATAFKAIPPEATDKKIETFKCCFCTFKRVNDVRQIKKHCLRRFRNTNCRNRYQKNFDKNVIEFIKQDIVIYLDITNMKCETCQIDLNSLEVAFEHLKGRHSKLLYTEFIKYIIPFKFDTDDYKCLTCLASFSKFHELTYHLNAHYMHYICPTCNTEVYNLQYTKKHHSKCHKKSKKCSMCQYCKKIFTTADDLIDHEINGVTPLRQGLASCKVCKRRFCNRKAYDRHERTTHSVYTCDLCEKSFCSTVYLRTHSGTHMAHLGHSSDFFRSCQ